jgi:hypothetical protein
VADDPGRSDEEFAPPPLRTDEIPARANTAVPEPHGDENVAGEHVLPAFLADDIPSRAGAHDEEE